ncbi:MAG: monovalent cation/H(+) antiporter subunit G [Bacteroidales bacterium]|nr:monovalent cation/H(+) antiporter subunit G [Bacteroidales bacterium]MCF8458212.1 monovalent cation/H(+) antiporter subunit G [Bacteroidales bacterium]
METLKIIGAIITLIGSIFLFLGALGLLRMPDVYTRIQAGTKASTLGTILSLLGIGMIIPGWYGKIIILIVFVLLTNPVSSHVLARAAHYIGIPLSDKTIVDKLEVVEKLKVDKLKEESPELKTISNFSPQNK